MNKQNLIEKVFDAGEVPTRAAAERVVEDVLRIIREAVASDSKVSLGGFGIFEKKIRKARTARNPRTGEAVEIPAMGVVKFRPAQSFKEAVK